MTPIQIQATVPEEPPVGSVVLDRNGRAWQSTKINDVPSRVAWLRCGASLLGNGNTNWAGLLLSGPVTLIHSADPE